ncbi:MAG: ABZJ_00895 family protein [Ruegeria sp.]|uniref:ABZJ_00895 family protein n=1 Tax=Ruegeria sp. TaxID=1879320 RepID=UPI00349E8A71
MGSSILRFSFVFIATSVAIPIVILAVQLLLGINLSSSAVGFIPFMTAAMTEGQRYVKEFGDLPSKREMWLAAVLMGWVGMTLSFIMGGVLLAMSPELFTEMMQLPIAFWLFGFVIVLIVAILMCRGAVGVGARSQLKQARRGRG